VGVCALEGESNSENVPVMVSITEAEGVEESEGAAVAEPVAAALTEATPEPVPLGVLVTEAVAVEVTEMQAEGVVERVTIGHAEAVDEVDTVCVDETVCVGGKVPLPVFEGVAVPVFGAVPVPVAAGELLTAAVPLATSAPVEDTVTDVEGAGAEGDTVTVLSAVLEDVVDAEDVIVAVGVATGEAVAE